jgi:hypothetical protein
VGDPVIDAMGLPDKNRQGREMTDIIADTVADLLDGLSKAKRRDPCCREPGMGQEACMPCARDRGMRKKDTGEQP